VVTTSEEIELLFQVKEEGGKEDESIDYTITYPKE
jgi:hypothetical protein